MYPRYHFSGTGSGLFAPALVVHEVKCPNHADRSRYLNTKAYAILKVLSFDLENPVAEIHKAGLIWSLYRNP